MRSGLMLVLCMLTACSYKWHLGEHAYCASDIPVTASGNGAIVASRRIGDASEGQIVQTVSLDSAGGAYIVGKIQGTATIGTRTIAQTDGEGFVAHIPMTGEPTWILQLKGTHIVFVLDVRPDTDGGALVMGYFVDKLDVGPEITLNAGEMNQEDIFVVKVDAQGTVEWARNFGDVAGTQQGWAVARHPDGDVVVSGHYRGTISFHDLTSPPSTEWNVFLAKLSPDGSDARWLKTFGIASGESTTRSLAINDAGDVLISGQFRGAVPFNGQTYTATDRDAFVLSVADDGAVNWMRTFGGPGDQQGRRIALHADGSIAFAGYFKEGLDLGCANKLTAASGDAGDSFLAHLDANGMCLSLLGLPGAEGQYVDALGVDMSGAVTIGGAFSGTMSLPGRSVMATAETDGFVAHFWANGELAWFRPFGVTGQSRISSVSVDPCNGNIAASGAVLSNVPFDADPGTSGRADADGVVLYFAP